MDHRQLAHVVCILKTVDQSLWLQIRDVRHRKLSQVYPDRHSILMLSAVIVFLIRSQDTKKWLRFNKTIKSVSEQ